MRADNLNKKFNSTNEKKYELIQDDEAKKLGLYRVRALRDFGDIKKGEIGGFVSGEHNLSHMGNCWIADNAVVSHDAQVLDNACVSGHSAVTGRAKISGHAIISGWVQITGDAEISGRTCMTSLLPNPSFDENPQPYRGIDPKKFDL